MNSFNHYAYGAIGEWLYRYVAGIRSDEHQPGFHVVHIEPQPGPGLDWVEASMETMYGQVTSSWHRLADNEMEIRVHFPANTKGTVRLPGAGTQIVLEHGEPLDQVSEVQGIRSIKNDVQITLGSGSYQFTYKYSTTKKERNVQEPTLTESV
ncbi:alpha-L-rhamnosidase C-terminal domain-containing protein [Paenibacillus sp. PCH8]|uniref:alpha-L-rhamnosidase C-terminal domain-containing protein n=1 Tax=Paenibacillus sp. PCH8 TaxID=2066524 RepID=UPI00280C34D6|nr:alpha-L-rhamnosidase C-terminal domain-containing protein [Paenibacillus sp. PCH8]